MSGPLSGPWKMLPGNVPFYIVTFDKNGNCTAPQTLDGLVRDAAGATDVFLFSHGWNNDWAAATQRYDDFVARYGEARSKAWNPPNRDYRPILVGVFWPSTVLVTASEQAPDFAGGPGLPQDLAEVTALAEDMPAEHAQRFYELAQRERLDKEETREFAAMLAPMLGGKEDELDPDAKPPTAEELIEIWRKTPGEAKPVKPGGFIDDAPAAAPAVAGIFDFLDPRKLIRGATVLLMKDRAGRVGAAGVASMLRRLIDASPDSRVHLVGHSYGAKVVLSALCHGSAPSRPVDSVLLLQPAMSCFCFAGRVPGADHAGGYRTALERSRQPIMTTFSGHDFPLTKVFHWAVRRSSDLGEAVIAGVPPSTYAALGGYGPQGVDDEVVAAVGLRLPNRYEPVAGKRIIAIDGTEVISDHGDVANPATAWALLNQVMG